MIRLQRGPLEVVDIIPRHWRSRRAKTFAGRSEATQFLRELVFESGSVYAIRDLVSRALHRTDVNLLTDYKLIDLLANEILHGDLKVVISVRESPMPPQVLKPPDVPALPTLDIPKIPTLPPLELPKIPDLNINLQLDVLDLASLLGLALAEICPKSDPVDSSSSGSSAPASSDTTSSDGGSSDQTSSGGSSDHSSPDHSSDHSSTDHSSDHSSTDHSSDHSSTDHSSDHSSTDHSSDTSHDKSSEGSSDHSQSSDSPLVVNKLTLSDPHFNFDSALVLPDFEVNLDAKSAGDTLVSQGLQDIGYALELSGRFKHHRLLVAGHTDTMGAADYNQALSEARANAVLALLANKKDDWTNAVSSHYDALSASRKKRIVIDLQYVMTWAARLKGWACDPKGIDGKEGPNTDSAIDEFGKQTGSTVDLDTPSSWLGPTFDLYNEYLKGLSKIKKAGGLDKCVKATNDPPPVAVGFGLNFPLVGSPSVPQKNEVNRRVELIWFPPAPGDSYSYLSDDTVEVYTGNAVINPDLLQQNGWEAEPKLFTTDDASGDEPSDSSPHPAAELTCEEHFADDSPPAQPSGSGDASTDYDPNGAQTYEVVSGDTLSAISETFYDDGTLWYLIWSTNQDIIGPNWNLIQPGQVLNIMPLDSFSDDDIAEAQAQAPNWNNPPSSG